MTRRNLAIVAGIMALALAAWLLVTRDTQEESQPLAEAAGEQQVEGLVELSAEQIRISAIEVVPVELGAAVDLTFPATVSTTPTSSARIDARASGVVRSLTKTLGDFVRRGETVARIESAEAAGLASQVNTARARATELSAVYARERRLFEENVTARQDLEAARANLSVAQAELSRAQAAVAAAGVSGDGRSLSVTSPLSGRITAAPIVLGSFVTPGAELYRVVDPAGLQVEVAIPAADVARISPGDEAALLMPGGVEVGARVRSVTPSLDAGSRSATAVLSLARPVPGLQPGAFVQARLRPAGETDVSRIAVPEDAVQVIEGREVVFVRTANGFLATPVRTGERSAGRITILSGLAAGARIATRNAFLLKAELGKEGSEHGH
jgi:cobalt-zinc-cadmium efflux system membrane fusion protein